MEIVDFELRGEHIALDALLKAVGLSGSGGAAKAMVASGKVQVDGREELRKTCKIRAGQVVSITGHRIRILAAAPTISLDPENPAPPEPPPEAP